MRRSHVRRRGLLAAGGVCLLLAVAGPAQAALTQVPVKNNPLVNETYGAASDTWLVFTRNSIAHPRDYALYSQQLAGGPVVRVNALRTRGYPGSIVGSSLIYQQVNRGQSDIRMYDLDTNTRSLPPAGINTTQWEYDVSMTPDWILFVRSGRGTDRVMLYNRADQSVQQIGSVDWNRRHTAGIYDAQVNGQYAAWSRCTSSSACQIKRRDLTAGTTTSVPNRARKIDYASSVGSDGTVYFARSGRACGASVRLRSYTVGGLDSLLVEFKNGVDVQSTSTFSGASADDVYFSKIHCKPFHADLYKVSNP